MTFRTVDPANGLVFSQVRVIQWTRRFDGEFELLPVEDSFHEQLQVGAIGADGIVKANAPPFARLVSQLYGGISVRFLTYFVLILYL